MRKIYFVLSIILFILSGCFYDKEAKALKADPAIQKEIEATIIEKAKRDYAMDVSVNLSKLKFTYPSGKLMVPLPIKTSKRLEVPVEVVGGEPSYDFKAYIEIYDRENDQYVFDKEDELAVNIKELYWIYSYLLEHLFTLRNEELFEQIKEFDHSIKISLDIKEGIESHAQMKEFYEDYVAGKFNDPMYYDEVFPKYVLKPNPDWRPELYEQLIAGGEEACTPIINLRRDLRDDEKITIDEQLQKMTHFIETEPSLPNGRYHINVYDKDQKSDYEHIVRCH